MPRLNVIVLDRKMPGSWQYVLWADVPAARQPFYASTGLGSLWKGALASDLVNLQSGAVTEQPGVIWTPGFTTTQLQTELQGRWTQFQLQVTNYNPWVFYGSNWDGAIWTTTGIS